MVFLKEKYHAGVEKRQRQPSSSESACLSVTASCWRVHDVSEETRMSGTAAVACAGLPRCV